MWFSLERGVVTCGSCFIGELFRGFFVVFFWGGVFLGLLGGVGGFFVCLFAFMLLLISLFSSFFFLFFFFFVL